jgi:solute carrier family 32 (vesicular inhibitory amino acid transporter)
MKDKGFSSITCLAYAGVNVLCGVGILSTPYAVKQGGWLGLVILAVLGALAWYTGILLRRCLDSKEGLETYPDIGHAAFGTAGRIIISVCILFSTLVMPICYSVLYCLHYIVQWRAVLC